MLLSCTRTASSLCCVKQHVADSFAQLQYRWHPLQTRAAKPFTAGKHGLGGCASGAGDGSWMVRSAWGRGADEAPNAGNTAVLLIGPAADNAAAAYPPPITTSPP